MWQLGLGALALAFSTATAPASTTFLINPYVEMIRCNEGLGSGFKLDTGQWVSVNHVTKMTGCRMNGKPITVTYADPVGDFSLFTVEDNRIGGLRLDCSGYRDKEWYHGVGHAKGLAFQTVVTAMVEKSLKRIAADRGWEVLIYSRFIPGQSGGPVLNQNNAVSGTVNAFDIVFPVSYSRALKDTILCA